ncbi:MAG: glycosyltransferase family 2 protein [Oscillospiraceae bacterium]|nr:glycosyltransferase family 2 protein [Oscillospiraceae bacterium]
MPKTAVLLASFNSEPYLSELIQSILKQSERDFSLYIRDDCSSDESFNSAAALAGEDGRIRLARNEKPSGSAQNNFFTLLLECPKHEYYMFADGDDFWLPEKIRITLERMRELEARHGANTPLLVHGDLAVADGKLNIIAPSLFKYEKLSPERKSLKNLLAQNNVTGCTVMINQALREFIPARPKSSVMHDWWCALIAAAFGEISVIYEPLVLYRQHGSNEVGAYEAGDLSLAAARFFNSERNRRIYSAMFAQAACFAETFKERLSPGQLESCLAYAGLAHKGKAARLACVFKYGFYKNTLLRNLGQLLAI